MRLPSRAVSILCLAAVLVPLGASAAVSKMTLRDLGTIIQSNKKPLSFDISARGVLGKASATLSITGKQNGNLKSLAKAAAEITFVLDAKLDGETSGHAKVDAILINQTTYLRLTEFTATGDWEVYNDFADPYRNIWVSRPVDQDEYAALFKEQQRERRTSTQEIEAFFDIVTEELRDRTRYTVTIPKNKQRRLLSRILGARNSRQSTTIDFNLTVDAIKNVFSSVSSSIKITSKQDGEMAKLTLSGKTNALKATPSIGVPYPSTTLEEFLQTHDQPSL